MFDMKCRYLHAHGYEIISYAVYIVFVSAEAFCVQIT